MKRLLNTLYVMTQGAYLKKEGEAVNVLIERQSKLKLPLVSIQSIVCFGDIMVSPALMGHCTKSGISMCWLSFYGKFIARVEGPVHGNILLRRAQYKITECPEKSISIAKAAVAAKIANARSVLVRALKDHPAMEHAALVDDTQQALKRAVQRVWRESDIDSLRGIEGDAAKSYFGVFNELITTQKADFNFSDRNRRPPLDRVNALLSFIYVMLANDMRSACEVVGLDPQAGFFHVDRPGRMSLALDLMEEFRPFFADRLVLSLINLKQVTGKDFEVTGAGAVLLNEKGRKTVVAAYQARKQDAITHPFLGEEMHIGILMLVQAQLLARHLREDLDGYPAFFWR
ncbi:MAG: subtype I-C CRISPR-associated endonuclease Cas1 [Spirochaetes bacterium GWD1_61_31]|nr:MAG: subtype I-C CRISPR-associated endonuclease Cas1 [Spirochaetes bacterium GWB1_60_80]OHD39267.1 MAG: subtype I-C CRISPR-associated endonuclease Cas1 [Spirochaetes bacterium GWD1_61_31]OHD42099.1 MAG: subtype I-C CRISPR-associated endonuclease Cas1 [Spirochaetes bacterium GWE1_60_18]OHD61643.1 MAG: subtype I-C CRISPR-associated endonuclease Cas1 [Spirochaetes bacterium GWF1_60_12]